MVWINSLIAGILVGGASVKKEELRGKIKECWDSINSERALDYASYKKLEKDQLKVAVVVQKMVNTKKT